MAGPVEAPVRGRAAAASAVVVVSSTSVVVVVSDGSLVGGGASTPVPINVTVTLRPSFESPVSDRMNVDASWWAPTSVGSGLGPRPGVETGIQSASGLRSTRRRSCALAATMIVEALIAMAPIAGGMVMPAQASAPAASGMARML